MRQLAGLPFASRLPAALNRLESRTIPILSHFFVVAPFRHPYRFLSIFALATRPPDAIVWATMNALDPKQKVAILRILRDAGKATGSVAVAKRMQEYGFDLSARTLRLYLHHLADQGLVDPGRRGRSGGSRITQAGINEIDDAVVLDRIGFTSARVDRLAWEMRFDPVAQRGEVVLNVTVINQAYITHAAREMAVVFQAGLGMGEYVAVIPAGERIGNAVIPPGKIGLGTVCSVTVNGVLLNARIPAISRFGAVLELRDGNPTRFTDLIAYEGTTLDPLEIFIKAGLTDVHAAAVTGNGRIGVSFREVPTSALAEVERVRAQLDAINLRSILLIGKPNQPLLDFPVHEGRTGLIVIGGLNPAAALEEAGVPTANQALCSLYDFEKLIHYRDMQRTALEIARRM